MRIFLSFLLFLIVQYCETPQKSNQDCCLERQNQKSKVAKESVSNSESMQEIVSKREQEEPPISLNNETEVSQTNPSKKTFKTYPPEKKQEWKDYFSSLKRNCPYSSLPSEVIASCRPEYRTYDLSTPEKKDIYYYALLSSNDYARRKKAYYYYRSTCNETLPVTEILQEKKAANLPDWEKQEIQNVISECQGEPVTSKQTYFPGAFSFHPQYPSGNGEVNFYYVNEDHDPITITYSLEAENLLLVTSNEKKEWQYIIPPNATLDEDISLLVVGHGNSNLKLIKNVNGEQKELNSTINFFSIGKGFSPRFWSSNKPYPVYYFAYESGLNLIALANDNNQQIINKASMKEREYQNGIYLYEGEIPLNGYSGWVTTEIVKEK